MGNKNFTFRQIGDDFLDQTKMFWSWYAFRPRLQQNATSIHVGPPQIRWKRH